MLSIHHILKQYWGYDNFRPHQEDIINAVLKNEDVLALLPTGGGKSVCFQVPGMMKEGTCLVVCPLIALIKDQMENLQRKNIPVLSVYAGMSFLETKKTLQNAAYGNYKFLYVSPERLETSLFLEFLPAMNISMIAVDEAHCISQWGYDFRPAYLRIATLRDHLPGIPVLALTASATKIVREDIAEKLLFKKNYRYFQQPFERPNLSYSTFNVPSPQKKLLEVINNVPGAAIVYCRSRKHTVEVANLLFANNICADFYHAGLTHAERSKKQESWLSNDTRVIVCTNAFGMGIDKPDVRLVVHYDVPECMENYYQEAGRAGRDGKKAYAVLLFNNKALEGLQQLSDIRFPAEKKIKEIYTALMNHLQVAAGSGEGMSFDFDITAFTASFKLSTITVAYVIKVLEQEGLLSLNEIFLKPSTVVFTAKREELEDFEKQYPDTEPLIKGLLRSYEGIFDFPATVYESGLSKFLRKDIELLKKELKKLNDFGIIRYIPQKETPQLALLQNRMYADAYAIDATGYLKRKKIFTEKVAVMVEYCANCTMCRSQMVAAYFMNDAIRPCGICDNCISKKRTTMTGKEFDTIAATILTIIKKEPTNFKEILNVLKEFSQEKIWKTINYLQAEKKIQSDHMGNITIL